MSSNPGLTTQQQKVLALIACGFTATAAAEQAGVHRNTVANWLRIDEFKSALERARGEKELLYWDQAEALAAFGIANLRRLAMDAGVPPSVQLKATMALMEHARCFTPATCAVVLPDSQMRAEIPQTTHNDAQAESKTAAQSDPKIPVPQPQAPAKRSEAKIGRNDLCSCGSGLKFKRCCLGKLKPDDAPAAAA